jgi:hypothetical protein
MKHYIFLITILIFAFFSSYSQSNQQVNLRKSRITEELNLPAIQLNFGYSYTIPSGILASRYGNFNGAGLDVMYRNEKGWLAGGSFFQYWGGGVKEGAILDSLSGKSGYLIDDNGNLAIVRMYMYGYQAQVYFGKLFPLTKKNPNSGILLKIGTGVLQHRIKFQHTINVMPQLEDNMYKGYDRLSNGIMGTQFIGYQYSSLVKTIHFWGGVEFMQASTVNRRGFNYDTRQYDNSAKLNFAIGFKAGFIIPIYLYGKGEKPGSEIYFD